jgi:UDP-N-acetylglucosamine 2-epimerase (non-hydrolysing)
MALQKTHPILFIVGTRPEVIKVVPVYLECKRQGLPALLCVTLQHREMVYSALKVFGVQPDVLLDVTYSQPSLAQITSQVVVAADRVFSELNPSAVIVQGDTASMFSCGLAAFYRGIPVGHIEAGLRTYRLDSPFPEEYYRQAVSRLATWHFVPTKRAYSNLLNESMDRNKLFLTGNTIVDAFEMITDRLAKGELQPRESLKAFVENARESGCPLVLFTAHRRESWGIRLQKIFTIVKSVLLDEKNIRMVYPIHKNPRVIQDAQIAGVLDGTGLAKSLDGLVCLTEPLPYHELVYLLNAVDLVVTDSGGIQEEATCVGKPVVCLRECTERIESLENGNQILVGKDLSLLEKRLKKLAQSSDSELKCEPSRVYGDGSSSKRIVEHLARSLGHVGLSEEVVSQHVV